MAHNEFPVDKLNVKLVGVKEYGDTPPAAISGGTIYLSGGTLCFRGVAGTLTVLAAT